MDYTRRTTTGPSDSRIYSGRRGQSDPRDVRTRTAAEQNRASRPFWHELRGATQRIPPWALDVAIAVGYLPSALHRSSKAPGRAPVQVRAGLGPRPFPTPLSHYVLLSLASLGLVVRSRFPLVTLAGVVLFGAPYWVAEPR